MLGGISSLRNGLCSEAFLMFWSLIESDVQRRFMAFWSSRGRAKNRVKDMMSASPVSHQIDVLEAAEQLDTETSAELSRLRKIRNQVVHSLQEASLAEAEACFAVARVLSPVPGPAREIGARRAIIGRDRFPR
jgi:hypothetical protein